MKGSTAKTSVGQQLLTQQASQAKLDQNFKIQSSNIRNSSYQNDSVTKNSPHEHTQVNRQSSYEKLSGRKDPFSTNKALPQNAYIVGRQMGGTRYRQPPQLSGLQYQNSDISAIYKPDQYETLTPTRPTVFTNLIGDLSTIKRTNDHKNETSPTENNNINLTDKRVSESIERVKRALQQPQQLLQSQVYPKDPNLLIEPPEIDISLPKINRNKKQSLPRLSKRPSQVDIQFTAESNSNSHTAAVQSNYKKNYKPGDAFKAREHIRQRRQNDQNAGVSPHLAIDFTDVPQMRQSQEIVNLNSLLNYGASPSAANNNLESTTLAQTQENNRYGSNFKMGNNRSVSPMSIDIQTFISQEINRLQEEIKKEKDPNRKWVPIVPLGNQKKSSGTQYNNHRQALNRSVQTQAQRSNHFLVDRKEKIEKDRADPFIASVHGQRLKAYSRSNSKDSFSPQHNHKTMIFNRQEAEKIAYQERQKNLRVLTNQILGQSTVKAHDVATHDILTQSVTFAALNKDQSNRKSIQNNSKQSQNRAIASSVEELPSLSLTIDLQNQSDILALNSSLKHLATQFQLNESNQMDERIRRKQYEESLINGAQKQSNQSLLAAAQSQLWQVAPRVRDQQQDLNKLQAQGQHISDPYQVGSMAASGQDFAGQKMPQRKKVNKNKEKSNGEKMRKIAERQSLERFQKLRSRVPVSYNQHSNEEQVILQAIQKNNTSLSKQPSRELPPIAQLAPNELQKQELLKQEQQRALVEIYQQKGYLLPSSSSALLNQKSGIKSPKKIMKNNSRSTLLAIEASARQQTTLERKESSKNISDQINQLQSLQRTINQKSKSNLLKQHQDQDDQVEMRKFIKSQLSIDNSSAHQDRDSNKIIQSSKSSIDVHQTEVFEFSENPIELKDVDSKFGSRIHGSYQFGGTINVNPRQSHFSSFTNQQMVKMGESKGAGQFFRSNINQTSLPVKRNLNQQNSKKLLFQSQKTSKLISKQFVSVQKTLSPSRSQFLTSGQQPDPDTDSIEQSDYIKVTSQLQQVKSLQQLQATEEAAAIIDDDSLSRPHQNHQTIIDPIESGSANRKSRRDDLVNPNQLWQIKELSTSQTRQLSVIKAGATKGLNKQLIQLRAKQNALKVPTVPTMQVSLQGQSAQAQSLENIEISNLKDLSQSNERELDLVKEQMTSSTIFQFPTSSNMHETAKQQTETFPNENFQRTAAAEQGNEYFINKLAGAGMTVTSQKSPLETKSKKAYKKNSSIKKNKMSSSRHSSNKKFKEEGRYQIDPYYQTLKISGSPVRITQQTMQPLSIQSIKNPRVDQQELEAVPTATAATEKEVEVQPNIIEQENQNGAQNFEGRQENMAAAHESTQSAILSTSYSPKGPNQRFQLGQNTNSDYEGRDGGYRTLQKNTETSEMSNLSIMHNLLNQIEAQSPKIKTKSKQPTMTIGFASMTGKLFDKRINSIPGSSSLGQSPKKISKKNSKRRFTNRRSSNLDSQLESTYGRSSNGGFVLAKPTECRLSMDGAILEQDVVSDLKSSQRNLSQDALESLYDVKHKLDNNMTTVRVIFRKKPAQQEQREKSPKQTQSKQSSSLVIGQEKSSSPAQTGFATFMKERSASYIKPVKDLKNKNKPRQVYLKRGAALYS